MPVSENWPSSRVQDRWGKDWTKSVLIWMQSTFGITPGRSTCPAIVIREFKSKSDADFLRRHLTLISSGLVGAEFDSDGGLHLKYKAWTGNPEYAELIFYNAAYQALDPVFVMALLNKAHIESVARKEVACPKSETP